MAESQSKRRNSDHFRGNSSSGRFFKRRRGQWGHSRGSINAALAIVPTTTAPLAANGGNVGGTESSQAIGGGGGTNMGVGTGQQQLGKPQRHGRKRRRHRHSSFSGGGGGDKASAYSLPPAVAAALAIPPKTPEAPGGLGRDGRDGMDDSDETEAKTTITQPNGFQSGSAIGQASSSGISGPNGNGTTSSMGSGGKKKKRRRRRRQWKPYYKLTADERRELEEREEKRAERVRAQRFAHGQPVAPYNTTQFLLRDRELRNGGEPDCGDLDEIVRNIRHHTRSGSYESPGAIGASDSEGGDVSSDNSDYSYFEREFDNDWLDEQKQRLEAMTKDDLVKEFMDLQKQYESAQRDMRSKRLSYEEQILALQRENTQLRSYYANTEPSSASTRMANIETVEDENVGERSGQGNGARNCPELTTATVEGVIYSSPLSASTKDAVISLSLG